VNVERTTQALATRASTIAVACPFCMTMLTDGVKAKGADEATQVRDLAELVAERLADVPDASGPGRPQNGGELSTAAAAGS
jgi:Fe-S oxidoreductase